MTFSLAPGLRPIGTSIEANQPLTAYSDDWYRSYDQKTRTSAEAGSERLRDECLSLFQRFEREHGLPTGAGMELQHKGFRA